MGKNTDKLFITHSEWSGPDRHSGAGGISTRKADHSKQARRLPFSYCALSLQPFEAAVCDVHGNIFDKTQIETWLDKFGTNPVTGEKIIMDDLISLNFQKDEEGRYIDPVTFKVFTPNTHIVTIKPSGNVFSWETVELLNIKAKNWQDIVSGEKFSRKEILTLQDPMNVATDSTIVKAADAKISSRKEESLKRPAPDSASPLSSTKRAALPFNASVSTNGRAAMSLTSTASTPYTKSERQILTDEEYLLKPRRVKEMGYVQIRTNLGNLNVELNTEYAPRTVYNFVKLAEKGYYKNVKFHRNIKHFMIQGGDPTGTGRGGQSYWGKPFEDEFNSPLSHDARGVLAMANKGKNTNTSQFFLIYRPKPQLDRKHTIFGKVIGGIDVLDKFENAPTDASDRPLKDIVISDVLVIIDPFKVYMEKIRANRDPNSKDSGKETTTTLNNKGLDDTVTWSGKVLNAKSGAVSTRTREVGKYL
ncbi:cyclophilin-like domain-containing protein [Lipomyces doorenjongii]|uniref:cyclophilin-like domain-containing protein n=1 Tax=Lipomyces doorenjongii TaxID=383834 RepID=UPI0034CDD3C8